MIDIKSIQDIAGEPCKPCRGGDPVLTEKRLTELLGVLNTWQLSENLIVINRHFVFRNFEKTMNFINQVAIVADKNDHHPDVRFGYNYCHVDYSTHAIQGLSENDFICAAQIEMLFSDFYE